MPSERGLERLVAFSDAVVPIPGVGAWALLVLLVAIPAERLGRPRVSRR